MRRHIWPLIALATIAAMLFSPCVSWAQDANPVVVIVPAPYLQWGDLSPQSTPELWSMIESGAIGNVNARSRIRSDDVLPSPNDAALSLSAGAWTVPAANAPAAYNVDEGYERGSAAQAFERATGMSPGDNAVVFLGLPQTQRVNAEEAPGAVIGALGSAVQAAGGTTAAIGNSDALAVAEAPQRMRPAALTVMDKDGLVDLGDVSSRMLESDPRAPFGVRTDVDKVGGAFDRVLSSSAKRAPGRPVLIAVDPGDLYRSAQFASQASDSAIKQQRADAVGTLDQVIGRIRRSAPDATVIVTSQQIASDGNVEGLGPLLISSGDETWRGLVTSPSTQRTGLATNLDVTATALKALGVDPPSAVLGRPLQSDGSEATGQDRVEQLVAQNAKAVSIELVKTEIIDVYVALMVGFFVASTIVLLLRHRSVSSWLAWSTRLLETVALLLLAAPPASWLMFLVVPNPMSANAVLASYIGVTLVLWLLGVWLWSRRGASRLPVVIYALGTAALLLIDQWAKTPLSFANFWGYSPLPAARFYGIGNEGAALLFGSALVGLAMLADEYPHSRNTARGIRWGLPVIGAVVVITAAAPFWGANVGVAVWGTFGFALAWWLANGHRFTWKLVVLVVALVAVLIVGFAAIDLLGGGAQTHLGRSLSTAGQGGAGVLWEIVARKAETNVRVLTHTVWAYVLLVVLAFLAYMRFRPHGDFVGTLSENPRFADAITVALSTGLLAYFTEDSGIVIPAMICLYVGIGIVFLMLTRSERMHHEAQS